MLNIGDTAPDFNLLTGNGELFHLSEALKKQNIVLYFYPKDDTRGCTAEACSFRDQYEVFQENGAEVVGISSDDAESHQRFAAKYELPFVLLSDAGGKVRKQYQVPRTLGLIPGRVTYVIGKDGKIKYAFNSQTRPLEHVNSTIRILKEMNAQN